jgi:hypothetical protein
VARSQARLALLILVILAIGIAAGYAYRRVYHPTLEERIDDAAQDIEKGLKKLTR